MADEIEHLLPTPRATDGTKGGPNQRGSKGDLMLPSAVVQLLPTPAASSPNEAATANRQPGSTHHAGTALGDVAHLGRFGAYAPAIASHERLAGRAAPDPTEPGKQGKPRLSAKFVEFMMCLPDGHVTDVPSVTRSEQLALLGNGVCPPQAVAALRHLLT